MNKQRKGEYLPPILMEQEFGSAYQKISDLITGHTQYCLLLSALHSGVLDILGTEGPTQPDVLLERIKYRSTLSRLWIEALVEIGIIEWDGGGVRICGSLSPYLVSDSPLYQGNSILSARESPWCRGTELAHGDQQMFEKQETRMTPEFLKLVAEHSLRGEIQDVTKSLLLKDEFKSARTLLDIGGGHGMYSISFCQQNPNLCAVILDRPHITESTRETVEYFELGDRIEVISGDMNQELPGTSYDLLFASHVLYRKDELTSFFTRCMQVLQNGGLFISNHKFADDWKKSDRTVLEMLEIEKIRGFHQMIPIHEYEKIMRSVGLDQIEATKIPANTGHSTLHTALKR